MSRGILKRLDFSDFIINLLINWSSTMDSNFGVINRSHRVEVLWTGGFERVIAVLRSCSIANDRETRRLAVVSLAFCPRKVTGGICFWQTWSMVMIIAGGECKLRSVIFQLSGLVFLEKTVEDFLLIVPFASQS